MGKQELRVFIKCRGWANTEFARRICKHPDTVQKWLAKPIGSYDVAFGRSKFFVIENKKVAEGEL
ncbi:hypothetical protein KAR91_72810 [Candidatus Pacearchaeota archaeon]|nr:hypothetical protein [Candidatus Pacearchaeota archaeon]